MVKSQQIFSHSLAYLVVLIDCWKNLLFGHSTRASIQTNGQKSDLNSLALQVTT